MPFIKCPECGKLNSVKLKNCPKCETSLDGARASYNNTPTAAPAPQFQSNPWGQPAQQTARQQQPQSNPWGQPAQQTARQQQPQNNPWGQPAQQTARQQQPQNNPWGQPAQQTGNPSPQPTVYCQSCGAAMVSGARFCGTCGAPAATTKPNPAGIPTRKNPYCL